MSHDLNSRFQPSFGFSVSDSCAVSHSEGSDSGPASDSQFRIRAQFWIIRIRGHFRIPSFGFEPCFGFLPVQFWISGSDSGPLLDSQFRIPTRSQAILDLPSSEFRILGCGIPLTDPTPQFRISSLLWGGEMEKGGNRTSSVDKRAPRGGPHERSRYQEDS